MNAFAKRDSISLFHSESEERIAELALPLGSKCAFLEAQTIKNPPAVLEAWFDPWVGKISWRRGWQPIPAFLPGEFHGQRSLVEYSP